MRYGFVSLGGIVALAAMAALAGCGGAAGTATTKDYVTPLVGTWMSGKIAGTVTIPAAGETPEQKIPVTRVVTATIAKGTGSNMGTVSLKVTTTAPESAPPQTPNEPIHMTGSIKVSESAITVTNTVIRPEDTVPENLRPLLATPQTLKYELMDNDLRVSGQALTFLEATTTAAEKLTLKKQAAAS